MCNATVLSGHDWYALDGAMIQHMQRYGLFFCWVLGAGLGEASPTRTRPESWGRERDMYRD